MSDRGSEPIQIEFEPVDGSLVGPSSLPQQGDGNQRWPAAVVALIAAGILLGLFWLSSNDQRDVPDETAAPATSVLPEPAIDEPQSDVANDSVETESVIPDSSSASIALEPTALDISSLGPSSRAVLFRGQILALNNGQSTGTFSPLISRSSDGLSWEQLDTRAVVNGTLSQTEFNWLGLHTAGEGLVLLASVDQSIVEFTSTDGVEWQQVASDPSRLLTPLDVSETYLTVWAIPASETLAQFVEQHTTATEVDNVCFASFSSVVGCDRSTQWEVISETIDSEFSTGAVLSCLEYLSAQSRGGLLSRTLLGEPTDEEFSFEISGANFPLGVLDDGRITGIEAPVDFGDPTACEGLATEPERSTSPEPFYIFDPTDGTVLRAPLHPDLDPVTTQVLGLLSNNDAGVLLLRSETELWSFNLATDTWTPLDLDAADSQPRTLGDNGLTSSGSRLYFFDDRDLHIIDFDFVADELIAHETIVYVTLPASPQFIQLQGTTDSSILFQAGSSTWLLDIPSGLRCAEEFAEAVSGDGLLEAC